MWFRLSQEDVFGDPLTHEKGELGRNVQTVPKTTKVMKVDLVGA